MLTIFEHLLSPVEEDEAQQEVDDTKQAHTTGSSEEQQKQGQPEGVPEYNNLKEHNTYIQSVLFEEQQS